MIKSLVRLSAPIWMAAPLFASSTLDVPNTFPTIGSAITAAASGDTILVQPGTYFESNLNFGGKDLLLVSTGGASATTINANGGGRILLLQSGETLATLIEGFTFSGGVAPAGSNGAASSPGNPGLGGGAVFMSNSSATFRACRFSSNSGGEGGDGAIGTNGLDGATGFPGQVGSPGFPGGAGGSGGAIQVSNGQLVLELCTFDFNLSGEGGRGGKGGNGGNGNQPGSFGQGGTGGGNGGTGGVGGAGGHGGAIDFASGTLTINGCEFRSNRTDQGGSGGNGGFGGGGSFGGFSGGFGFTGEGGNGGALNDSSANTSILGSSFAYNIHGTADFGGAINTAGATLRNTIVWANDFPGLSGATTSTYCDMQDGNPGVGNISVEPFFLSGIHLHKSSPCINAADPDFTGLLITDIDGETRLTSFGVDIGADEASWELMGTIEDLSLETSVNGGLLGAVTPKVALAGNTVIIKIESPLGTFDGAQPWIGMQGYTTGAVLPVDPIFIGMALNTTMPGFTLFNFGSGPFGPWLLPPGGLQALFVVPPGIVGLTVRVQGFVISPLATNGIFASTDGLEILLE